MVSHLDEPQEYVSGVWTRASAGDKGTLDVEEDVHPEGSGISRRVPGESLWLDTYRSSDVERLNLSRSLVTFRARHEVLGLPVETGAQVLEGDAAG